MPENAAIALMKNCTVPWRSLDSQQGRYLGEKFPSDTQEQVQRCLHCQKSECNNCIGRGHMTRMEKAKELFCKYFYAGLSRKVVCSKMNISRTTYFRYKKLFIVEQKG